MMDDDNIHSQGESTDEDPPFDPQQELDKGDPEDVPMHDLEGEIDVTKKRKGRGPSKGSKVKEPMHLEYDAFEQPCGKWRHACGKQIGVCVRKLSIVVKWEDVPHSLRSAFWDETVNLFHIEATEAKRNVFLSAVAQWFRDFKSKLVSGFITKKRKRSKKEGDKKTPPDIWPHVSKDDWEAFVAQKTTLQAIKKRSKATKSAKSRTYWHTMGPKTFEQRRSTWEKDGIYPHELIAKPSSNGTQSTSTSTGLITIKNRMVEWWCSLHGLDENGNRIIKNPATKRIADSLIDLMWKEAAGR